MSNIDACPFIVDIANTWTKCLPLRKKTCCAQPWRSRAIWGWTCSGRDAPDLLRNLRHALDGGNFDRATTDPPDLFAAEGPDYEDNSERLLCRDWLPFIDVTAVRRLLEILRPETDDPGALLLAKQSDVPKNAHAESSGHLPPSDCAIFDLQKLIP